MRVWSYLRGGAILIGGFAVVGFLAALWGIGLMDLVAARDVPLAATMFAVGTIGLAVLRIVGKRSVRNLPQLEQRLRQKRHSPPPRS